jgi:DNA-binding MarR family transcriptional regulator
MILQHYLEVISFVERLHRHFLEVVKIELDSLQIHDINSVQALILFNIGDQEVSIGELTERGFYLGSNVSYNVRKLVETGYLEQERSVHDRRSHRVRLTTPKGRSICDLLRGMHSRHVGALSEVALSDEDLKAANATLHRLERFWLATDRPGRHSIPQGPEQLI